MLSNDDSIDRLDGIRTNTQIRPENQWNYSEPMSKDTLSKLTNNELRTKLKTLQTLQITTAGIFVIIILTWILLGFWKTNSPVFIITVVVAIGLSASQFASGRGLRSEINKRSESAREATNFEDHEPR